MYKVMIVDDEAMVRKGIVNSVSWDNYGIEEVLEAENGQEALTLFQKNSIDIIITDMKMPIMDGIELIVALRKIAQSVKIVVVSGYSDYVYLKEAIRLNVLSYILKPINNQELDGILSSVVSNLELQKSGNKLHWEGQNLLKQNTLSRLVEGQIDHRELREKSAHLGIALQNGPFCVFLLQLQEESKGADEAILLFAFANMIQEMMEKEEKGLCFEYSNDFMVVLFDGSFTQAEYRNFAHNMKQMIEDRNIRVDIGEGDVVMEVEEIAYSYTCARNHLKGKCENKGKQYCKLVRDLLEYIEVHFKEDITLKQIGDLFFVNASYLGSLFKKEYGIAFVDCVNRKRLEYAKNQLQSTNLKIYEIAQEVGFKETRYFARLFKNYYGVQPSDVRK